MSGINHVAAWVAGIAHFLLGGVWYTAFGKTWMAAIGKTEEQMIELGNSPLPYIVALGGGLIVAYTIAWLLPRVGAQSTGSGAITGATLALALIATTMAMNYGFEARPVVLWVINAGYMVLGMALMGAIIGAWRKNVTPTSARRGDTAWHR